VFSPSSFSFFVTSCLASVRHTQNSGFQVNGGKQKNFFHKRSGGRESRLQRTKFFCFFPARPLGRRLFTKRRFFLPSLRLRYRGTARPGTICPPSICAGW
jgi:hypothetical protein